MKFIKSSLFIRCTSFTLIILLLGFSLASAENSLTAEEILDQMKDNTSISASGEAIINLITENDKGQQRINKLKIYRREKGSQEKQLLEYLEPADVEGTKFLSINNTKEDDTLMWLYLPALGRERRIAGHMTKDNFMGTDFTFEEIGGGKDYNQEYQAERMADEQVDGYNCYHLKLQPREGNEEYSRLEMWVWQEEMMPLIIDFYDQDGELSKKLSFSKLKQDDNQDYIPQKIVMNNLLEGSLSIVEILESSSAEVKDFYFTMQYLRR